MNTEKVIPLRILEDITDGFSLGSRIGKGGYADVYKGVYNGRDIAVKLLYFDADQGINDKLFENEVGILLKVDEHPNIVKLVGYCYEIKKILVERNGENRLREHISRVICFEHLEGGSLHTRLREGSFAPDWTTRYNIIKGICEGLNFLHKCVPQIWHLDLKPANILLDSYMVPKLADLGLSRLFTQSHTHVTENIRGSWRYMPPEFINGGNMSAKNDVFSLGVLMIDIMTGLADYSNSYEMGDVTQSNHQELTNWSTMIEARWMYRPREIDQMKTCLELAKLCVDFKRDNRPTVEEILKTLNKTETDIPKIQCCHQIIIPRSKMVNEKVMIAKERDMQENVPGRHEVSNHLVTTPSVLRVTTASIKGVVVGRQKEKREILSILSESSTQEITFLSLYGIGGIGKTTMAQLVFNNSLFKEYSRVWIYVSQAFDLDKIGNYIITQLSGKKSEHTDPQMIENCLQNLLSGKRVLIILDDLWEKEPCQLEKLESMLKLGKGSNVMVVVTTREEFIANTGTMKPYKLAPLTDDICWTIMKNKSSFEINPERAQLEFIGKDIARKCGGMALAAQSIGYMLKKKKFDEWVSVNNSEIWDVLASGQSTHHVHASLLLSYHSMNEYLKLCFAYCATFPKGHQIALEDLAHQWVALGLVGPSTFSYIQTSHQYIRDLLGMSFLEHPRPSFWTRDTDNFLIMHDLVHDLARSVVADEINIESPACQYAWLTDHRKLFTASVNPLAKIRSLHFLDLGMLKHFHAQAFSSAKCLCVLDLRNCAQELPDSIGHLKQLRYLDASWDFDFTVSSKFQAPPESILIPKTLGSLNKLQYLNLSYRRRLIGLPEVIIKLTKLRYLNISHCQGYDLLDRPSANQSFIDSVGTLPNLEQLDLSENDYVFSVPESFSSLKRLNLYGCQQIARIPENVAKVDIPRLFGLLYLHQDMPVGWCVSWSKYGAFPVRVLDSECSSSLVWLKHTNPDVLCITKLENVKSVEEARSIRLMEKNRIKHLYFQWYGGVSSVGWMELLTELVPPSSVKNFTIMGFKDVIFPQWFMCITKYLPNLVSLKLWGLNCSSLPSLVQLPNLRNIVLGWMHNLEELNTACSMGEYAENEFTLAKLDYLEIYGCKKLRIKPCPPRAVYWYLVESDYVLSSWGDCASSRASSSSYSPVSKLKIEQSELPLYQWTLLHHLPGLSDLTIGYCYDMTISPQITRAFSSLKSLSLGVHWLKKLPEWLGELTSLRHLNLERYYGLEEFHENMRQLTQLQSLSLQNCEKLTVLPQWLGELPLLETLKIDNCKGIISLPESILSNVQELRILHCLKLNEWLQLQENQTKLAHIKENKVLPISAKAHEETTDLINMNAFENLAASNRGTMTDEMHPDLYTAVMNVSRPCLATLDTSPRSEARTRPKPTREEPMGRGRRRLLIQDARHGRKGE